MAADYHVGPQTKKRMDMRKGIPKIVLVQLLLMLLAGCDCLGAGNDFDEGHEWIMPRPAAEIHIEILNTENEPVTNAKVWVYLEDERTEIPEGFINYDGKTGWESDGSGKVILQYLGEKGGAYEVPMNSEGPPQMKADIEAQGYSSRVISMDELLYRRKYRIGTKELEYGSEKIELVVIEHRVILEEQ